MRSTWYRAGLLVLGVIETAACGGVDRRFDGGPPKGPLAVGARAIGGAGSETCRHGESGSWCSTNTVQVVSLLAEPVGIFALEERQSQAGSYTVRALKEGTARITITANDGYETRSFTGDLTALSVTDISVAPVNRRGESCSLPLLYGTAATVYVPFELFHDKTALLGTNLYPFEATGVSITTEQIYDRKLGLKMPTTAGAASLTSKSALSFTLPLQIFEPSEVQSLRIGDPAMPITTRAYNGSAIPIDLLIDGRAACDTSYATTYTVSTPEQCTLSDATTERRPTFQLPQTQRIQIYGLKAGTCTLTVSLDGTGIAATKNYTIGS